MRHFIRRLYSPTFQEYFRPFAGFLSGDVITYLIGLVTFTYVAREVGPGGYGYLALAASVTIWLEVLTRFGMQLAGARWIAPHKERALQIMKQVIGFRFAIATILIVLLTFSSIILVSDQTLKYVLIARSLIILASAFNIVFLFVGLSRPLPLIISGVSRQGLYLLLLIIFLKDDSPVVLVPLFNGAAMLLVFLALIFWVSLILPREIPQIKTGYVLQRRHVIEEGTPLVLSNMANIGYYNLGVLYLGIFKETSDVGIFGAAVRILQILMFVTVALSRTFGPKIAIRLNESNKIKFDLLFARYQIVCRGFGIIGAAGMFLFAKPVITMLLGVKFSDTAIAIQILSLALLLKALYTPYVSLLIYTGHTKAALKVDLAGLFVCGGVLFILVPHYGYIGASIASVVGALVMWGYSSWTSQRLRQRFEWDNVRDSVHYKQ